MPYLIVLVIVILFIFFLIWVVFNSIKSSEKNIDEDFTDEPEMFSGESFDEKFFENTRSGEKYQQFLSICSEKDCSLIRGLLQANEIPTYIEGEHMNSIYGGIAGSMNAVVAIRLYILYKDYDRALDIIKEYIGSKIEHINTEKQKNTVRGALDIISAISFVGGSANQDILGIIVFPKSKE